MATAKVNVLISLKPEIVQELDTVRLTEKVSRNSLIQLGAELLIEEHRKLGSVSEVRSRLLYS